MFIVYVLKSTGSDKYYIGQTKDLEKRLQFHNSAQARWTKRYQPWVIIYKEEFSTRSEAARKEKELKKLKGISKFFKKR